MAKLLWVGDDRRIVDMTAKLLRRRGHEVFPVVGAVQAEQALDTEDIDVMIFDADPDDRAHIFRMVRGRSAPPKLLWLSADAADEVPVLNAGADDWMKSPYSMDVLTARIAALLRTEP